MQCDDVPDSDRWLGMQRERKPSIREGPQYQAEVPSGPPMPRPTGAEEDDPRAAIPGPSPEEALAMAAGPEKDSAEALPLDARLDAAPANNGAPIMLFLLSSGIPGEDCSVWHSCHRSIQPGSAA
jgi:hypothetical protein